MIDFWERVQNLHEPLHSDNQYYNTVNEMRDALLALANFEVTEEFVKAAINIFVGKRTIEEAGTYIALALRELKLRIAKAGEGK